MKTLIFSLLIVSIAYDNYSRAGANQLMQRIMMQGGLKLKVK